MNSISFITSSLILFPFRSKNRRVLLCFRDCRRRLPPFYPMSFHFKSKERRVWLFLIAPAKISMSSEEILLFAAEMC